MLRDSEGIGGINTETDPNLDPSLESEKLLDKIHSTMQEIKERELIAYLEAKVLDVFKSFEDMAGIKIKAVEIERDGELKRVCIVKEE